MFSRIFGKSPAESTEPGAPIYRILMVCMGNICRSPTAEAVMRHRLEQAGLADRVQVDSAGTHAYHVGSPPDERAQKHARQRGYELGTLRARKVHERDFTDFDLIVAMDWDNLSELQDACPDLAAHQHKLKRLLEFGVAPEVRAQEVVPDPYYGGPAGFEAVLDLVEAGCDGLLAHVRVQLTLGSEGAEAAAEGGVSPSVDQRKGTP